MFSYWCVSWVIRENPFLQYRVRMLFFNFKVGKWNLADCRAGTNKWGETNHLKFGTRCQTNGSGKNWLMVDFRRRIEWSSRSGFSLISVGAVLDNSEPTKVFYETMEWDHRRALGEKSLLISHNMDVLVLFLMEL